MSFVDFQRSGNGVEPTGSISSEKLLHLLVKKIIICDKNNNIIVELKLENCFRAAVSRRIGKVVVASISRKVM